MCGRFTLTPDAERLHEELGIGLPPDYEPRYNIAPGQPLLAIAGDSETQRAGWLLWGLIPWWRRERPGRPLVNLRADHLHRTVPRLLERKRCLIPADGFYEWLRRDGQRQPMFVHHPGHDVFTLAGLWDRFQDENGEEVRTTAIITTAAQGIVERIHDRMPLIVQPADRAEWLGRDTPAERVAELLGTRAPELVAYPVSTHVNNARNEGPECLEPV
jgi:putative SOS response-associated peptidase YedK